MNGFIRRSNSKIYCVAASGEIESERGESDSFALRLLSLRFEDLHGDQKNGGKINEHSTRHRDPKSKRRKKKKKKVTERKRNQEKTSPYTRIAVLPPPSIKQHQVSQSIALPHDRQTLITVTNCMGGEGVIMEDGSKEGRRERKREPLDMLKERIQCARSKKKVR